MPWRWCVAALLAFPTVVAAQDSVRTVTLEQATAMALQADPDAVAAEAALSSSRADLLVARGAWLPTLGLNSGYGNSSNERLDAISGNRVSESYTAQVGVGYELFSGGRRGAVQRSARAGVQASDAELRAQRFETILATTEAFYAAAAGEELVRVAEQRLERARQQGVFARTRVEVGSATSSDLLRAELEVGNAELAVLDAESALRSARLQLGRQIGIQGAVRPAEATLPVSAPELPPAGALAARAERSAPSALSARAALEERSALVRASRSAYFPSLRTTAGYDWFSFGFPPSERSWSVRLFASFPVFDGFQREAAVDRARAAERVAEAQARDAGIAAGAAAEDAAREVESAERRVQIATRAIELAREDLRVQEQRYRIGASTLLELQTSQVALADAEVARVQARQAPGVAVARLETTLGTPIEEL